jgi:beta-galactosidase
MSEPAGAAAPLPAGSYELNQGWLFGGEYTSGAAEPGHDDSGFQPVTLPHTVVPLSWGGWNPAAWERVWIYRRHLNGSALAGWRVFAGFDGVMASATAVCNGARLAVRTGGYLPWSVELTRHLRAGDNVLAVIVDSRCLPVPPNGGRGGAAAVDFLQPGGIYRDAVLRLVPPVFLADVAARPASPLSPARRLEVRCVVDAATVPAGPVRISAELLDGDREMAAASTSLDLAAAGPRAHATLVLRDLGEVTLWSPETPKLYTVRATLTAPARGGPAPARHTVFARTGFREARFTAGGFYLNGERRYLAGLNRHQLYPYTGMAAPARLQRRDAEILRRELNCDLVRCAHYPPSPHFLDACDELGLMVWEEVPGWRYVGGRAWREQVVRDVAAMVARDRNRPSVVIWGTRLNETRGHARLYARTRRVARELDGSRPTTGAMDTRCGRGWGEDVFAYNDYHDKTGQARLRRPRRGVPYLVSEAVGALAGPPAYRWADPPAVLAWQALLHALVHDQARGDAGYTGLLGWAAADYASLNGGRRVWQALKTPGVLDTFRVPKPGAAFYRSQADPGARPVVLPAFFWGPRDGPGPAAMIATNCDRLEVYLGGVHHGTYLPDRTRFRHLRYPPAFADLPGARPGPSSARAGPQAAGQGLPGGGPCLPDLRIDGYLGGRLVTSARMSADPARDRLALAVSHPVIEADGTDTVQVTFTAVDAYGNLRHRAGGEVRLALAGPAELIGDNPFSFGAYGPAGAAFVRSLPGRAGQLTVTACHPALGCATVPVTAVPPAPGRRFAP